MKVKFLGGAGTVTGSKFLLEYQQKKILVDCGLFQGKKDLRLLNWEPFPVPPSEIDEVVLTHAHIDHSGFIPILVREGFAGKIHASEPTRQLCEVLLRDSGRIQEEDARRANRYGYSKHKPALPLYTEDDAIKALKKFQSFPFGVDVPLGDEMCVHASRAGHILGASILTFRTPTESLVFTGDLGRFNDPIMKRPATIQHADYLFLESTYGNRLHSDASPEKELGAIIQKTAERGGTVLIPSFAVGRSQKVLYLIHQLKKSGSIPDLPVYLDSPMAQDATDILRKNSHDHRLSQQICEEVCGIAEYVQSPRESEALHGMKYPAIIISASGMAEGGRVLHHLKHYAPNHINSIVFVGFQAPMTRGDRILSGAKEVKIHGSMVPIKARVEFLDSLSSHADYQEILEWLEGFVETPRRTFLVHGEPAALSTLKEKIEEKFGWEVSVPDYLQEEDL